MFNLYSLSLYLLFLLQLIFISYYLPKRMIHRMRYIIKNFPEAEYPKLYVEPIEYYYGRLYTYRTFNMVIFIIGIFMMTLLTVETEGGYVFGEFPLLFGLVQFAPLMFLEITEFKKFKTMRKNDKRTHREADLIRRKFFDYTSPAKVAITIALQIIYILVELFSPNMTLQTEFEGLWRIGTLIFVDIFYIIMIAKYLYGKKINPYEDKKDREQIIEFLIKSTLLASLAISTFFIAVALIEDFDLDNFSFFINSAYFQVIAFFSIGKMLKDVRLEDINFDVYKADQTEESAG